MSFVTTLKEQSPAYAAYTALPRQPKNAPRFTDSPHGYPIVEPGELFCRMDGVGRPCCGTKLLSTESLLYHMEAVHGAMRTSRPVEKQWSSSDLGELERLHYFYKHLMKDEAYPGKSKHEGYSGKAKTTISPEVEAMTRTTAPTRTPDAPKPGLKRKFPFPASNGGAHRTIPPPRSTLKRKKTAEESSTDAFVAQMILTPNKRPRPTGLTSTLLRASPPKPPSQKLEPLALRGEKLLKEIAVKEASIKSELKESQLKEVRIKAELLEAQLLEAQIAQDVSKAKLRQLDLGKELKEIVEKDGRVRARLEGVAEGRGRVVDLLDDEDG
ncbi:hypothetical protein M409DRAFT_26269 [Zasmidium cellare ATCC 36951]|uniref:Uncharacterized protein n=1 Tax=Zasmidium cellare ATCC 36951 TaxID=1080233 RepID=A0A6A6C7Y6_ZASCE|nr:uncharacterized protein M409DRAFT_26269 [Zasmidium cellare ATCC 36951]KAF2163224.1 hypothetical protein M409DRAFT_26269 [Zasmidium cellare ATCC 36951]